MSDEDFPRKESLAAPTTPHVTWSEYIGSAPGECPYLGRKPVCKESSKAFKATVAMSEDFPLSIEMLLNVLEVSSSCVKSILYSTYVTCYKLRCGYFSILIT